ncbi:MAG TPA: class III lanthionine synthetase LanKC [Thermoanaerobaculia bacterium]|nr:class III lanthionine synthetase LanKC [Thermoanaerobaculia bacterium]
MSSIEKFTYTLAHPEFYEPLDFFATDEVRYQRHLRELLPNDWKVMRESVWLHCMPPDARLVYQGWKIHLSAVTPNAVDLFRTVIPVLVRENVTFKTCAAPTILSIMVSKRWHRGGAGKCMTVYPFDTDHFIDLIELLHQATLGHEGPYILSDRRYKDSKCVFYRYGGIAPRSSLTAKGDRVPYLLSPEGEQVPDRRQAWFHLPPWAKDPFASETASTAPAMNTLKGGRYRPEAALRHTNSGGLYLALDTATGEKVVIKEARPLTNVDPTGGTEAKDLLAREYRLLTLLDGAGVGPRAIDFFQEWEHTFFVQEYLDGMTLRQHSILHNVARFSQPSPTHFAEFYSELRRVFEQLAVILQTLHRHQVVFRDLSPTNVIILKTGEVRLVDFEAASQLGVDPMSNLFTPGFASSDHFSSDLPQFENDYFSLGALMLAYLMPMHAALGLDTLMHHRFIRSIGDDYGFPESLIDLMNGLMSRDPALRPAPDAVLEILAHPSPVREPQMGRNAGLPDDKLREAVSRIVHYTLRQATPERKDRLFPCDPKSFATNPLSLAYGACGTVYALHRLTGEVPAELTEWILRKEITTDSYAPGLYSGMAGIAWVLLELGFVDQAREILDKGRNHPVPQIHDLFYGLAGWGMTQLKFYHELGELEYLDEAVRTGRELLKTRIPGDDGCHWAASEELFFGLAHGASGVSLFLLYLYLATGNEEFLRVGQEALDFDLAQAVDLGEGLLWPSRTGPLRTVVPYWRYGSAGVGAVLLRYSRVADNERYRQLLQGIKRAAIRKYAIFPHRGFGLAGLGEFLVDMAQHGIDAEECREAARSVASGVMLFHLDKESEGIAFPGADLWKISCDYTAGSAGIALFFDRLLSRRPADFLLDELFPAAAAPRLEPSAVEAAGTAR